MPISENGLASILKNAQQLMTPDGDRLVESKTSKDSFSRQGGYQQPSASYNQQVTPVRESYEQPVARPNIDSYSTANANLSKLPKAIRESMATNRIDVTGLANDDGSKMDRIINSVSPTIPEPQVVEKRTTYQSTNGIDYSIIKAIVNECIDRKFEEFKEKLNENTLKGVKIGENNKIKFIDTSGNVFLSEMKYIGKVKSKK